MVRKEKKKNESEVGQDKKKSFVGLLGQWFPHPLGGRHGLSKDPRFVSTR